MHTQAKAIMIYLNYCSCCNYFRRASNNRARASWKCKLGKENCIIASETKSFCKRCRYSKCIEIGMKPSLVDKTKKAVEEFYANQSCSTVSSEQSPIEEIYSEESVSKVGSSLQYTTEPSHPRNEYLLQPQQNAIEILSSTEILPQSHVLPEHMFFKETTSQKVGSIGTTSSFHCDLEEQVSLARQTFASLHETGCNLVREKFLISNKYTPEEISYFSFVSNAVKLHQYRMMNRICSDPQCQNELLDYTQQIKAIEQTGSNHLKYSPILEGKMKHIGIENVGLLFEAFNPEVTGLNLNSVSKLFSSCQDVLSLFFNHAYSDVTHRHLHEIFFPKNDFPLPAESVLDLNNPDIIHSNLFASPWASSLRLEEFFYQTAESVKELLKDPVKVYIVIPILIASYSTDAGKKLKECVVWGVLNY